MPRHRAYCYTLNNWTWDEVHYIEALTKYTDIFKYHIFGFEKGLSGTKHLQGYIQLFEGKTINWLKDHFSSTAHFEVRKGSHVQASEYCKKEGDWIVLCGTDPGLTVKTITEQVLQLIKQGIPLSEIEQQYPSFCFHHRKKLEEYITPVSTNVTQYYVFTDDNFQDYYASVSKKPVIITDLSQLYLTPQAEHIVYLNSFPADDVHHFPKGLPIRYKYGYQWKEINPKTFSLCVDIRYVSSFLPEYKKIKCDLDLYDNSTEESKKTTKTGYT